MDTVQARLHEVIRSIFGLDDRPLTDADSPRTISDWDSANHIQLVLALETEFDTRFEPGEIAQLMSVGDLRRRLESSST